MAETKTYLTTDKAGLRVAGRIVPRDAEGKPTVGHPVELTDLEADYEVSHGTIALAPAKPAKASKSEKADPAS